MAEMVSFGQDLKFRTVGPTELALVALSALRFGLQSPSDEEAALVRKQVRALYPVFQTEQFAVLSTAFVHLPRTLSDAWWAMRDEIASKAAA
jgi:hypothetical protein